MMPNFIATPQDAFDFLRGVPNQNQPINLKLYEDSIQKLSDRIDDLLEENSNSKALVLGNGLVRFV